MSPGRLTSAMATAANTPTHGPDTRMTARTASRLPADSAWANLNSAGPRPNRAIPAALTPSVRCEKPRRRRQDATRYAFAPNHTSSPGIAASNGFTDRVYVWDISQRPAISLDRSANRGPNCHASVRSRLVDAFDRLNTREPGVPPRARLSSAEAGREGTPETLAIGLAVGVWTLGVARRTEDLHPIDEP
jgi:hypothetical protein